MQKAPEQRRRVASPTVAMHARFSSITQSSRGCCSNSKDPLGRNERCYVVAVPCRRVGSRRCGWRGWRCAWRSCPGRPANSSPAAVSSGAASNHPKTVRWFGSVGTPRTRRRSGNCRKIASSSKQRTVKKKTVESAFTWRRT